MLLESLTSCWRKKAAYLIISHGRKAMFEGTEIQGRGSDERMCGCEDGSALSWMDFYCISSENVLMCGVLPLLQLFYCYFLYYVCGCYTAFYTFRFDCINLFPCTNLISLLTSIKFHFHLLFSSLPSI